MPARPRGAGWTWRWHVGARCGARPSLAPRPGAVPAGRDDARRPPGSRPPRRGAARPARRLPAARRGRRRGPATRPTSSSAPPVLRPPSLRDFYAFEGHVRDDVGAPRRRGPRGVVPPADLLLQQRLRDPRAGRADLVAGGLAGARLRARGGGAGRHAGDRPVGRARRGGHRRLHDLQRLVGARPPARGDRRSGSGRPRARTSRARSDRGWSRRTSWPMRGREPATTWP